MNINSRLVEDMFVCRMTGSGMFYEDDVVRIRTVILEKHGIAISSSEAADFWQWRSEQYDAGWLGIMDDNEIIEWFQKFYDWFYELTVKNGWTESELIEQLDERGK